MSKVLKKRRKKIDQKSLTRSHRNHSNPEWSFAVYRKALWPTVRLCANFVLIWHRLRRKKFAAHFEWLATSWIAKGAQNSSPKPFSGIELYSPTATWGGCLRARTLREWRAFMAAKSGRRLGTARSCALSKWTSSESWRSLVLWIKFAESRKCSYLIAESERRCCLALSSNFGEVHIGSSELKSSKFVVY